MPSYEKYVNPRIKAQEIFFQEVQRRLAEAEKALSLLEKSGYHPETAMALYKFALTLKGNGQMVGLWDIADPASDIMVTLLLLGKYETPWCPGILSFLQERFKDIRDCLPKAGPASTLQPEGAQTATEKQPEKTVSVTLASEKTEEPAKNIVPPQNVPVLNPTQPEPSIAVTPSPTEAKPKQPAAAPPHQPVPETKKSQSRTAPPVSEEPITPPSAPPQPKKAEPPVEETKQPAVPKAPDNPPANKKVLLVDDDRALSQSIREMLTGKGFALTVAEDTKSAVQSIRHDTPDLVVVDIQKSTGDPLKLCQAIRSNKDWRAVPLIFLNPQDVTQEKLAGFTSSADDYLGKPFKPGELVTRIQVILNRSERSQELVYQDELTKLYNRRYLLNLLQENLAFAQRTEGSFSLGLLDLDAFKRVNELYGRMAGDETIICLVERIQSALRSTDLLCRYGGASFAVVMPNTTKYEGFCFIDRIREMVSGEPFPLWQRWLNIHLTFSAGISSYPIDGENLEVLLKTAESTLHQAKTSGKNRVSM